MMHSSIILPHMDYVSIFGGGGRCPNMVNNDSVLTRVVRVILRCKIRDISSKELLNTMNYVPIYDRVTYKRCLMIYKVP